eukprot:CAMPEP_0118942324 /NCGR_PEP_ID=MMETSP1169-20130426/35972_1 /TAXON_ID=36882 /ORGANISM="Pyramimonas obovata, Strain CCMP722" /LENGTH=79 /DNA_ID=CAMNT_0006887329 /DNA_START=49 /DNA_END=285 /DNA_ORIENTATION=+
MPSTSEEQLVDPSPHIAHVTPDSVSRALTSLLNSMEQPRTVGGQYQPAGGIPPLPKYNVGTHVISFPETEDAPVSPSST